MAHECVTMSVPLKVLLGASVLFPAAAAMALLLWIFQLTDCDWGCQIGTPNAYEVGGHVRCGEAELAESPMKATPGDGPQLACATLTSSLTFRVSS